MDILKLKSEIEKFQSSTDGEEGLLGPGREEQPEETTLTMGDAGQPSRTKKTWKQVLE